MLVNQTLKEFILIIFFAQFHSRYYKNGVNTLKMFSLFYKDLPWMEEEIGQGHCHHRTLSSLGMWDNHQVLNRVFLLREKCQTHEQPSE